MGAILDDLAAGQVITVLSWKPRVCHPLMGGDPFTFHNRSYVGDALVVVAVDLPFVNVLTPDGNKRVLDSRECELKRLRQDFVESMSSAPQQHKARTP